ncbi:type IIL restriction-modification enzyme MmeI (plasmid) [Deinococcus sp. VB343]|uniref:type IIL restriction-modification enzyme MmeI n=1 Tax=Deinococcus sp. VB343 TaxID=3385567 RepID=UPI0039C92088
MAIPRHSSERRNYIPFGFLDSSTVVNDAMCLVAEADLFLFGVMQSQLHMDWMRLASGRLESRYRYSPQMVLAS